MRLVLLVATGMTLCITGLPARTARSEPRRILHEYVPPPQDEDAHRWVQRDQLPDHIALDDRLLPRPVPSAHRDDPEAASNQRALSVRADRETAPDPLLHYTATFNPTVVPFKRKGAFDRVAPDSSLRVGDATLRPLRLRKRPTPPNRDAFWGSATLRLEAGVPAALPSVAPGAAIVSYHADPARELAFFRDGADNHWVRSSTGGPIGLVWLTDAPKRYFAEIPPLVVVGDVAPRMRPRLPPEILRQADTVLTHIGVKPGPVRRQLDRLVSYFRNFTPGPLQRHGPSAYLDLALSQRGVCRHRSYAFVITAQALGLPARYVQNEAHAFAEVFVPRSGWVRVDLGGSSSGLQVSQGQDKTRHRPDSPDPFPRPNRFGGSYSQQHSSVRGLGELQRRDPPANRSPAGWPRRPGPQTERPRRSQPPIPGRGWVPPGGTTAAAAGVRESRDGTAATASLSTASRHGDDRSPVPKPTALTLRSERLSAYRGETLRVWGTAKAANRGVNGLRIEIHLATPDSREWILIGAAATDKDGSFAAEITVPRHVAVGDYQLRATSPQTSELLGGFSE